MIRTIRKRTVLLVFGLSALSSAAQENEQPPQTPPPAEPPAQAPAPPAQTPAPQNPAPPAQDPPRASSGGADDVFIPTEELAADEEVTFPVDI